MAQVSALSQFPSVNRRRAQDTRNDQGREASPNSDVLVLGHRNATSQEEALKKIASLPSNRQGKVLGIRHQIANDSYEVADRLDKVVDRILEAITA
jgi:anti-sigma28 factor (negative regulator of flagellin synthesis)